MTEHPKGGVRVTRSTTRTLTLALVFLGAGCVAPSEEAKGSLEAALTRKALGVGGPAEMQVVPRYDAATGTFVVDRASVADRASVVRGAARIGSRGAGAVFEASLDPKTGVVRVRREGAAGGVTLRPVSGLLPKGQSWLHGASVVLAVGSNAAIVHTPRQDGVKEDIVLGAFGSDKLEVEWELELDPGLVARLEGQGVNVYGAVADGPGRVQPADEEAARLARAREQVREGVLYRIPAPVVREATGTAPRDTARFELQGTRLRLVAQGLSRLTYPVSIDPTILVTSSSDFAYPGNFEWGTVPGDDGTGSGTVYLMRQRYGVEKWVPPSSGRKLPAPRYGHCAVAYAGRLYIIGGNDGAEVRPEVYVASIQANDIGAFSTTTPLPAGREHAACAAWGGHIYVVGGLHGTPLAEVLVARIKSDGTLDAWKPTTALPAARAKAGAAIVGGVLYVVGGIGASGHRIKETLYAPIRGDGTLEPWTTDVSLPSELEQHAVAGYGGFLYVMGGTSDGTTPQDKVLVARILVDRSLTPFAPAARLRVPRFGHAAVAHAGSLYVLGGRGPGGELLAGVEVAPITASGELGSWRPAAPFVATTGAPGRAFLAAVSWGKTLLLTGGLGSSSPPSDEVVMATVDDVQNLDGHVADWRLSTTTLATPRYFHASVATGNCLYVIGGTDATLGPLSSVEYATIAPDGTVGPWRVTSSLTTGRYAAAAVVARGRIYVIGGKSDSASMVSSAERAVINSDCSLSSWTAESNPLPNGGRAWHGAVAYAGKIYVIGGEESAGAITSSVAETTINDNGSLGSWVVSPNALPAKRSWLGVALQGDRVYVVGGEDTAQKATNSVYVATFSGPSLGAFTSAGTLPAPRKGAVVFAHHGRLYVIGGLDDGNIIRQDTVVAPFHLNGSVGTWAPSSPLPSPLYGMAGASGSGWAFVTGGNAGGAVRSTAYAGPINANGMVGVWTSPLATGVPRRAQAAVVAANGYLYIIGGYDGAQDLADVWYARIQPDGTFGQWNSTRSLPSGRFAHAAVASSTYLIVLGGMTSGTTKLADVLYAPLYPDGTLGEWQPGTPLPTARFGLDAVLGDNSIYVTGGDDGSVRGTVHRMTLLDAPTNTWILESEQFSPPRRYHRSLFHNGKLYVIGGQADSTTIFEDVQFASVKTDGTLSPFVRTSPLPLPVSSPAAAVFGGYLYVAGGRDGAGYRTEVSVAPIAENGSLPQWIPSPPMPEARAGAGAAVVDGRLYLLGGYTASGATGTALVAPLLVSAPWGRYSWLHDFERVITSVDALTTVTAGPRVPLTVEYRVADERGVFGPPFVRSVTPPLTIGLGTNNVRYLALAFLLDESRTVTALPGGASDLGITEFSLEFTDKCETVVCTGECQGCDPMTGTCHGLTGSPCDDGDLCTKNDTCQAGTCVGTPYSCPDDGKACTAEVCDGTGGCTFTIVSGFCLIEGECYAAGSSQGKCFECRPETSQTTFSYVEGKACDDGDPTTANDVCAVGGTSDLDCRGVPATSDGGTSADGGTGSDGGQPADGGTGSDGGQPEQRSYLSCACEAAGGGTMPAVGLLVVMLGVAGSVRRRRP